MNTTNPSSQYFDHVAEQWDTIRAGYFTEELRQAAIQKAYLHPDMVVADVGCGTGFMAAGLAPLVKRVIALDGSQPMLDTAAKNLSEYDNIDYQLADGLSLPLEDETVEAVFANMYLHHCPDPLAAIREMVRILTPGGRLVITDMESHTHTWFKEEMSDIWLGFTRQQLSDWYAQAGLVNRIISFSGISCCAESNNPELNDCEEGSVKVDVFSAVGTKRVAMREQVQEAYSAAVGCGCGSTETSCCSSSSCESSEIVPDHATSLGYSAEEMASAPTEAQEVVFGCGNPTALAKLQAGETVLDIGSGGGLDAFLAAQKVGASGKVIGVDMTPAMIERASSTAERNGIHNVEFRLGQAEHLPVEAQSIDVVISNCVINLVEDKGKAFREIFRVLKPGGRIEISDIVTDISFNAEMHLNAGAWANCISGALPWQEYLDLITQAGFQQAEMRRSQAGADMDGTQVFSALVSARKPISCCCG